ncbi:hypothetical protein CHUAL_009468 [Chamberlinius hualienensis]
MFYNIEDNYIIDEDSDEDDHKSSDDEDPFFVASLLSQANGGIKRKMLSEAEDFEREMNAELDSAVNKLKTFMNSGNNSEKKDDSTNSSAITPVSQTSISAVASQKAASSTEKVEKQFYDDAYFDSDSEDDTPTVDKSSNKQKKRHPIISNDDLFYDPKMDQEDQDWVDKRRQKHRPRNDVLSGKKAPRSDAVLNCPACMTTLCDDCQRHEAYKNQYRAMFVMHCTVDFEKILENKPSGRQPRQKKALKKSQPEEHDEPCVTEFYHPVRCTECNTEVAVYDKEEVYHFFNVLTSHY